MQNAIEVTALSYKYPNCSEATLKNITLAVPKGQFVALMGDTGSGKTTLNLCLNGLIPQLLQGELAGQVKIAGHDLSVQPVQTMAKFLGLVLEDAEGQIFGRTVQEDVTFGPQNLGLSPDLIAERISQALTCVSLNDCADRDTGHLSGGEKQRLAIAGVLALLPEILVLDQPASELDPAGRREIYDVVDQLRSSQEFTVLLTEHNGEEILGRVQVVYVLHEGELVWQGDPVELFRKLPLLQKYGIRPLPVSTIGWELYQRGLIAFGDIPLNVDEANALLIKMLPQPGTSAGMPCIGQSQSYTGQPRPESPTAPDIIKITDLVHRYGTGQTALNSINLAIQEGDFVALVGRNGSGKTTLAKHLNGLLKPTEGQVIVNGKDTTHYDTSEMAKEVGFVFQNPDHQIFSATVEKEIAFGLKNIKLAADQIKVRVDAALEATGLSRFRDLHPFSLGKGERQLIAVASILAVRPRVLVIDEPTTGLDWHGVQNIMSLVKQLNDTGTTIVMISHDMELVAQYAKRVIVMQDGNYTLDGPPREVFKDFHAIAQASLVPPQVARLSASLSALGGELLLTEQEFIEFLSTRGVTP